jgi:magnesium transporter
MKRKAKTKLGMAPVTDLGSPTRIRAVYRRSDGSIEIDLPVERIPSALEDHKGTVWVDIEALGGNDHAVVEKMLRETFHFHPLAVEDALRESHVPRIDDWGRYLYLVFSSIDFDPETDDARLHELDLFLGSNYLVSYHTESLPLLDLHRRNIERDPENRLRHGADHLLYHLLDLTVADFMPALEHLDEAVEEAQNEVFADPTPRTLQNIFRIKRSAVRVHRMLSPMREVLNRLARDPYDQVLEEHRVYFRDVYDHIVRLHDISESLRDLVAGALDTYLSIVSNRTNDVMKTLTLVSVMFLPMNFLAGFFGMNFFGPTVAFETPLPKAVLFSATVAAMTIMPIAIWRIGKRRQWF